MLKETVDTRHFFTVIHGQRAVVGFVRYLTGVMISHNIRKFRNNMDIIIDGKNQLSSTVYGTALFLVTA
jgi:hypothetical protein